MAPGATLLANTFVRSIASRRWMSNSFCHRTAAVYRAPRLGAEDTRPSCRTLRAHRGTDRWRRHHGPPDRRAALEPPLIPVSLQVRHFRSFSAPGVTAPAGGVARRPVGRCAPMGARRVTEASKRMQPLADARGSETAGSVSHDLQSRDRQGADPYTGCRRCPRTRSR